MKKETRIYSETRQNSDDIQVNIRKGDNIETYFMSREDWLNEREERAELESMERQVNNYLNRKKLKR